MSDFPIFSLRTCSHRTSLRENARDVFDAAVEAAALGSGAMVRK